MTDAISLRSMPFDSHEIYDETTGETSFDRVAFSKDLADWMRNYFSNGILVKGSNVIGDELKVTHTGGLNLSVNAGEVLINGRTGWVEASTALTVDIGGAYDRIDRVVMELNIADRYIYLKILKGTEAASPEATALTQTEDVYQIPLAQVRVNAGVAVIASVTDERADHISKVTIGIEPPTANSAAAISVSSDVQGLTGAENVDEALKNIVSEQSSTEIGHVFTPSEIAGYNALTIRDYFKKKDEIKTTAFSLPPISNENYQNRKPSMAISPDGRNIVEIVCIYDKSQYNYYAYIYHTYIGDDGIHRYDPVKITISISDSYTSKSTIIEMDNDGCIVMVYNSSSRYNLFFYSYTSKTVTLIMTTSDSCTSMEEGYESSYNISGMMYYDSVYHFYTHNDRYMVFSCYSYPYIYDKTNNTYIKISYGRKAFKTPIGVAIVYQNTSSSSDLRHEYSYLELFDWTGTSKGAYTIADYTGTNTSHGYSGLSYHGCYGDYDAFYIALETTATSYGTEVKNGTGTYKIVDNGQSVFTKVSSSLPPLHYEDNYNSRESGTLHDPNGMTYPIYKNLYHTDLYDKYLSKNGLTQADTYKDKLSEYKAVPFYDMPLSDAPISDATALTTLTQMERKKDYTLGMVRHMFGTDWYMGNCLDRDNWFLFRLDESKIIPIKI